MDPSATTYKVTLVPAGGTISDATGWTLNAGNYEKEVSSGTELALPTFTKANRTFKTWRKAGPTDVTSPITVTADVTLTAVWNATVEQVIYSWESPDGTAVEVGGTAITKAQDGSTVEGNGNVNATLTNVTVAYKAIMLNGKISSNAWSGNYVQITTDEAVKAGDKVKVTACTTKGDTSKKGSAQMRAGTSATSTAIFTDGNSYNDILADGTLSPNTKTFTVPDGVNTSTLTMTRSQSSTNCWVTKLQIIRPTLVEEANLRTVTFNYNDGGATANKVVEVASGATVSAEAAPSYAHHRFHEWQLGGVAYDFATAVTSNITLVADWTQLYTVTYAKGEESATGDAPTQDELAAGEKFTVAANTFAYEGHDFSTWNDGSKDVAPASEYTMGSANVTLTAQWITATTKATVTYKDGTTTLGSEEVTISTGHPAEYATYQTRDLATFDAWYSDPDLAEEHKIADMSAVTVTEATTFYAKWNYTYAASANLEQWVLDYGKTYDAWAQLGTSGYSGSFTNSLDSLDDAPGKTNRNYAYLGFKVKNLSGKQINFRLANGSVVKVKFGNIGATPLGSINGADYAAIDDITDGVYTYTATGEDYISIKAADNSTLIFKQIMINEDIQAVTLPWRVTYNANGGTCATEEAIWKGSALILPSATPAEPADYSFAGWYDELSGGELVGAAGASYNATDNVTLYAHYAPVEYTINYNAGDHGSGADMIVGSAGWGTEYTAIANPYTADEGWIFAGWAVSGVDGVSTLADGGSFTMPKNAVTLTAQWEDNSKVAVIVETSVKYESLADAITDAEAGQTIQLLQNIEQANGVAIAKSLILDLNGKTYTCTSGSNVNYRAIKITAGNVTIQNGSIIAVPTANFEGGCYGPIRIEGETANVTLEDLTLQNGRHYGLGIKLVEGYLRMEDCTVISENGGGGLEVAGTADVINCTFTQTGLDNAHAWISTCLATCDNGVLNVQGGTYTSEHYSMYVYTSGGEMDVESGSFTGDVVNKVTLSSYPDAVGTVNISGGSFEGAGGNPIQFTIDETGKTSIAISGGSFDAPVENEYCAPGYVPSPADPVTGKYSVEPKDGVEIIGVVVTGNTTGTVSGLYQGTATVNLNSKKLDSGKYIYVTLKEGYTFEENDVLIVDVDTKSNLDGGTKALEITTGVGNIDGDVWKSIAFDDYTTGENIISLEGIAAGQTSIGLKRSANQNAKINGLRVLRPMKPMLTAITIDTRDGVINEAAKTVAVQIPYEADLAALTVVPTIVWNEAAATNSIVVNDGSAWIEGANTYKLTDKDGDYTVYSITLTRDVLKHTVSFNTHGGSAVASEEVEDGAYLAAAPADPTKEDYIFQYWSEDEDGAEVDVTTVQINADKEFHAVWASDGAIKLLDGSTVNHTNFITAVTATETVEFMGNTVNYAKFSGTVSGVNGVKDLTRVIAYNATTNKTKIQISAHNNSTSARNILVKGLVEGADAAVDLATIALGNKEDKVSEWIEFDNAANRTIYIMVSSSAGDVYFTQVKVIESGETPMKQAGEAGYSLNLNKGRFFGPASTDLAFEGLNARLSGDYTALNSGYAKLNATSMSFTVASDMLLTVTANNNKTYYVTKDAAGTDNETAKTGASEFNLTAGTWFITAGTAEVQLTNIAFALPKCEKPTFEALQNSDICAGDPYVALDGTGTVTDGGSITYKWYAEGGTDVLGTNETYTPTADGNYYVVALHHVDGFTDNEATSDMVSVTTYASAAITTAPEDQRVDVGSNATLSVVASGKAPLTYQWYTCDENGDNAVIIDGAESDSYIVAVTAGLNQYYKVIVTSGCGTASAVAKVEEWTELPQLDVTETTTWDWTYAGENNKLVTGKNVEVVMANIKENGKQPTNDNTFNSQALLFYGENVRATESGRNYASIGHIKFNVTVPGRVTVEWSDNGTNNRRLKINEAMDESSTSKTDVRTFSAIVPAGEVTLMGVEADGSGTNKYIRISKITFTAEADHERNVVIGNMGTVCLPNPSRAFGVKVYELAGKGEGCKVLFDELAENEVLEKGKAYVLVMTDSKAKFFYTNTESPVAEADWSTAMKGNLDEEPIVFQPSDENARNVVFFKDNAMWNAFETGLKISQYRAYLQYDEVTAPAQQQPTPGRRRVTLNMHGENVVTGIDAINASEKPRKIMIDGQIYILRGEKVFDATGRLVK